MFIQTETTPNPETLKFLPGCIVHEHGVEEFRNVDSAVQYSPLAAELLTISGINSVLLGYDFISVSKNAGEWKHLKPAILGIIMEHIMSGSPIVLTQKPKSNEIEEFFNPEDKELVALIKALIETRIRPAIARDGGDIMFRGFKDGIVYLNMRGACSNCPSSTATLKRGIENLLCHFIPEIQSVEALPQ